MTMVMNPRDKLIHEMKQLNLTGVNCANCTGVCCTDKANSMKIDQRETQEIYHYLIENNLWDESLESLMSKTIDKYRLDQEISTGRNSVFRRTYTCPFFTHQSLGCSLPPEVKPYGCLAFNPVEEGITAGQNCTSDTDLLASVEQAESKESIPQALIRHHKKETIDKKTLIVSNSTNPYFNLALEDYLLRETKSNTPRLLLWRNDPCVVWGKFQNPWLECDIDKARSMGLKFVRRQSGGGTVYHDLGNLNFSFFSDNGYCNRHDNLKFIKAAFAEHSVSLESNERNDLVLREANKTFKVSGSAFKQVKDRGIHHGTLLLDANLKAITGILSPDILPIETKAIRSVPSAVKNISEVSEGLNYKSAIEILGQYWMKNYGDDFYYIDEQDLNFPLKAKFSSWDWIWGETPKFNYKSQSLSFSAKKGKIEEVSGITESEKTAILNKNLGIRSQVNHSELQYFFN